MKKIIPGILSMLLCLGMATGCDALPDSIKLPEIKAPAFLEKIPGLGDLLNKDSSSSETESSTPDSTEEETPAPELSEQEKGLKNAKDYLQGIMELKDLETRKDISLLNSYTYGLEDTYDIAWSVDVEGLTIVEGEEEDTLVVSGMEEDTPFVLTATITHPDGEHTTTATFNGVALKALSLVPSMITEKPVANTAYKLYVYQTTKVMDCYFLGEMDGFYFKTTENYAEAVDIYVEYVDDNSFNLYFTKDGVKTYIGVQEGWNSKNSYWTFNVVMGETPPSTFVWDTELQTIITTVPCRSAADNKNQDAAQTTTETLYVGNYNSYTTISASKLEKAATSNVGGLVKMVDKNQFTPAVKVETEEERLTVKTSFIGADSVELPTAGVVYNDVAITWAVKSGENVAIAGNMLTTTAPTADTTAVITATIACGDVTVTKDFTITVKAETTGPAAILNQLYALADGESVTGEFTLTGKITALDSYNNPTIVVDGYDNMPVYCYKLVVDKAVGEYITVTAATMKNYGGKYEFMDCTLVETAAPDPVAGAILNQLYALADGESVTGEFTLTGKITELDSYSNPTIVVDGYDNMPVYCYKLKVTNAVGEYITVTAATMKNYGGKYEFMDCTLVTEGGEGGGEDVGGGDDVGGDDTQDVVKATGDSFTIQSYATANGWADSTLYATIEHENYTITTSGTPVGEYALNTGKYYASSNTWRIYQNENPSVVFTAVEGKTIATIKITYAIKNTGILTFNGANYDSDAVITVNAATATFGVGQTADKTNGQVQITAIEVIFATEGGEIDPPAHEHTFVEGKCECGEEDPNYVPPHEHNFVEGKCECGEEDPNYVAPVEPTQEEIVEMAYALAKDTALEGTYTLTGTIISIPTAYSSQFSNVTVVIVINDLLAKPIECYRLKGNGADSLAIGDTITVSGTLKNYSGKVEFDQGCTIDAVVADAVVPASVVLAIEKEALSVELGTFTEAATVTASFVPTFDGVVVTWTSSSEYVAIDGNVLNFTIPESGAVEVEITATITYNGETTTKVFPAIVKKIQEGAVSEKLATFDFGTNSSAAHVDGNAYSGSKSYTNNGYTLNLTSLTKVYGPAYDAKGNSCLKFGTSSAVGSLSFTVADDVNKVVIYVAKYKTNTTKINVNGTAYTLSKNSNNGEYDEIVVDTSVNKTVNFSTVSGGVRAMMNEIQFWS